MPRNLRTPTHSRAGSGPCSPRRPEPQRPRLVADPAHQQSPAQLARARLLLFFVALGPAQHESDARRSCWLGPHHAEHTPSRPIWEVKQRRARLVLAWVTGWEYRVPKPLTFAMLRRSVALAHQPCFEHSNFFKVIFSPAALNQEQRRDTGCISRPTSDTCLLFFFVLLFRFEKHNVNRSPVPSRPSNLKQTRKANSKRNRKDAQTHTPEHLPYSQRMAGAAIQART